MELSFLYSLQALHNPALDKVMIFFTNLGEYDPVVRVLLVAALFSLIISIVENEYAETIGIIALFCWLPVSVSSLAETPRKPPGNWIKTVAVFVARPTVP